jgi:hypothetical protein
MTSFSQRKGLKPIAKAIQLDTMDDDLRNGLWNLITILFLNDLFDKYQSARGWKELPHLIWQNYFKKPIDTIKNTPYEVISEIRNYYFRCPWNEVYDFIEFFLSLDSHVVEKEVVVNSFNNILQREVSAYRVIKDKIIEITSENELKEIEEALDVSNSLKPVYLHLERSLNLLADRKSPDYRNSIKEAISAVEAICKIIVSEEKATLGDALKKLDTKIETHSSLKGAFEKLYGYASDAEGIRHAFLDEPTLDFEDAKFMLVSCSAFINYLKVKSSKAAINL